MALTETTREYETLIRVNDGGKIGAHKQTITTIERDGQVVSSTLNDPEQLTLEQLQSYVSALTAADWFVPPVADEVVDE